MFVLAGIFVQSSTYKNPVVVITNQHNKKVVSAGKNPPAAVTTGRANIPAPTDVPVISNAAPKMRRKSIKIHF